MIVYLACFILLLIGLYCIAVKKNMLKIIIGVVITEYAVNLFIVSVGYKFGGRAPVLVEDVGKTIYVDPLVQALVLTSIVIGLATLALMVAVAVRLYEKYGTFDITEIRRLRG